MSTTIEDIQYLKKHGRQESYLFLVDSSLRNKVYWPTPSEYVIDFKSPFRHVYGVDVLEAYIPRTQYRLNERNNQFVYSIDGGNWKTLVIDPANYEIEDLVKEMNQTQDWKDNALEIQTQSDPPDLKEKVVFTCPLPFKIKASVPNSIRRVLGFGNPLLPPRQDGIDVFESEKTTSPTIDILEYPSSQVDDVQVVDEIVEMFTTDQLPRDIHEISIETLPQTEGTISFVLKDVDTNTVYESGNINESHRSDDGSRLLVNKLSHPSAFSSASIILKPNTTYALTFSFSEQGNEVKYMTDERSQERHACVALRAYTHQLIPPGLYDLTGDRFVQLRCREIEQYLYRTRVYDTGEGLANPGLAKFQLGLYGTHEDERFEYRSFPPRDFHPIGKLSSLTFRFECVDGSLYDFKGIDHNMTIIIRYWAVRECAFETRILNPNYDPNFLEYMQRDMDRRFDSEEEDEY